MKTSHDSRERVLTAVWWASLAMIAIALISVLISLPGAFVVAPWLFVLGIGGLIVLSVIRVHTRVSGGR